MREYRKFKLPFPWVQSVEILSDRRGGAAEGPNPAFECFDAACCKGQTVYVAENLTGNAFKVTLPKPVPGLGPAFLLSVAVLLAAAGSLRLRCRSGTGPGWKA